MLRWGLQNEFVTIPSTTNPKHLVENTKVLDWQLPEQDMVSMVITMILQPLVFTNHFN